MTVHPDPLNPTAPPKPAARFVREIEPMPKKERPLSQGKAGTGTRCGYCKSTEHTRTKDCPLYQAYKQRKAAGRPTGGHRKRKPITRKTRKGAAPTAGAAAAIRAEIASYKQRIVALKSALAVLEG